MPYGRLVAVSRTSPSRPRRAWRRRKGGVMVIGRWCLWRAVAVLLGSVVAAGCPTFGPHALEQTRLQYNEVVKRTKEEQLLLNIVRLRYTDTPSSLAVSVIAAQFEAAKSFQLT